MRTFLKLRLAGLDSWQISAITLAGLVVIPIGVIFCSVFQAEQEIWRHLSETVLTSLLLNTFWLGAGVLVCTTILGVGFGWLTGACSFPGKSFFSWALTLPMAIPAYVMAFIFIGVMDFAGPVQSVIRMIPGCSDLIFEVRSRPFVVIVISATLYPYVYLLSRAAFLSQGRVLIEAAQTLGVSPWIAFWKVSLPMARPWIVSGLVLVLMETLADFGTVSVFNYDTFTTAIYKAWFGFFSLQAAAQLSSILVLFALVLVLVEASYKAKMRFYSNGKGRNAYSRIQLKGWQARGATLACSLMVIFAFVLPVIQLVYWAIGLAGKDLPNYASQAGQTLFLGGGAAVLTCLCALLLSYVKRRSPHRLNLLCAKVSTIGYALPGTVLAIGIFIPIVWLDNQLQIIAQYLFQVNIGTVFQGTLFVMFMAYVVRFLAAGFSAIDSNMLGISPSLDEAASLTGVKGRRLIRLIHLPLLKKGLLTALILVMVDVVKEMPITLMTRPFGWDTLAVKIYELTSEGEWERAALPSLYLVLASIIPVILLIRQTEEA
ncbi:ABC transporter permease [Desulfotalea psychrophila]|uniref:Related to iron(III) ABC transporter, permease protein (HitB) n=1 Tax=Desulfotalea psychrophila (strain LSv54 / DSM 12343) TaxID=177439 RepID=Q6ANF0_DESPS|nr:iron ABC transporter permease [Desulfotalea psychrophila]CAG36124.1 related to iron(III) ABC transporter, permease protein (HitB) [Desulfotalea psychrophila LSv54]